jgi:hypothetical protein
MFSGIFNKKRFPYDEKIQKIMKESMDKYNRTLNERYKISPAYPLGIPFIINKDASYNALLKCEDLKIKTDEENTNITESLISIFPFVLFGIGIYQLCKGLFIKQ